MSNRNFFMKNMKKRYSEPDPDPLWNRIRIHFFQMWIRGSGSGSTITERWIRGSGSGSTFPKCGSQDPDPDPRQNEMDPKRCFAHHTGYAVEPGCLHGNFAVLLGNLRFQKIIWPWKSLKPEKNEDNFFALVFKRDFKLSFNMKFNKFATCKIFLKTAWWNLHIWICHENIFFLANFQWILRDSINI